jgi:hypothetical protein
MAAAKSPGREIFDPVLEELSPDIPPTYVGLVQLFRPDYKAERIRETRKGKRVDFAVLDELKKIVKIRRESSEKYLKA